MPRWIEFRTTNEGPVKVERDACVSIELTMQGGLVVGLTSGVKFRVHPDDALHVITETCGPFKDYPTLTSPKPAPAPRPGLKDLDAGDG